MKKTWIILFSSFALLASCAAHTSSGSEIPAKSSSNESSAPSSSTSSASSGSRSSTVSSSTTSTSVSSLPSGEVALPDSAEFTSFWDYSTSITLSLRFTNASLYALSHYGTIDSQKWGDVYFPCTLTVGVNGKSTVYEEVGARMKGNTSRVDIADASGNISGPCHLKLSFKATFDDAMYYDLDQFKVFKHN